MKYKSYEDSNAEYAAGSDLELLDCNDIVSARTINRPIINLLENTETDYHLMQTLLKSVYGNIEGVIPDIYEEFAPEGFIVGSFKNNTEDYFLRMPTGMMLLAQRPSEADTNNKSNPFLVSGEADYADNVHKEDFLQDQAYSYTLENKPQINLAERQLASMIDLDLTDLTNDVKIYSLTAPMAVRVELIDAETGLTKFGADGSPMYVENENSDILYLAKDGQGTYSISVTDPDRKPEILSDVYNIAYDKKINSKTDTEIKAGVNDEIIRQSIVYGSNTKITVKKEAGGLYTDDISRAVVLTDSSGNQKRQTGYYMNVVRSTSGSDENVWLPNQSRNASWSITLPGFTGTADDCSLILTLYDERASSIESFNVNFSAPITLASLNDLLFSSILQFSSYLTAEKQQKNDLQGDPVTNLLVTTMSSDKVCNSYSLKLELSENGVKQKSLTDYISRTDWTAGVKAAKKTSQRYYTTEFELVNAFLGYFSSYLIKSSSIHEYMSLETLFSVKVAGKYYIYADLDANIENGKKTGYDKTGCFLLSGSEKKESNFIKLFTVDIVSTDKKGRNLAVKNAVAHQSVFDRRLIATKRAELDSLLSRNRTELKGYLDVQDKDSNRSIEMTEIGAASGEQMRLTSPVLRLVDKKQTEASGTKQVWADLQNGDGPSDFYEPPYVVNDLVKGTSSYLRHKDDSNKGLIIDQTRGILLFNKTQDFTGGSYSYSRYTPVEIYSKYGNVNILNSSNAEGRVNIRLLSDSASNMVDILGKARIRSKNDDQLVVRRITEPYMGRKANIKFVAGESFSKDDTDTVGLGNLAMGEISFNSQATSYLDSDIEHNKSFALRLAGIQGDSIRDIISARNTQKFLAESRDDLAESAVTVFSSDIVPYDSAKIFGWPANSLTYSGKTNAENPYVQDADLQKYFSRDTKQAGKVLSSTGGETRWLGIFAKNGHFGQVTLADQTSDILAQDARKGALRLGASNIYDVSNLFINMGGYLNFNAEAASKENTIMSSYSTADKAYYFVLNRSLGAAPQKTYTSESADNYLPLALKSDGNYLGRNTYISRQLFVGTSPSAAAEDNSALVVKGQSVMQGEVIIGKTEKTVDNRSEGAITRSKDTSLKYFNEEFYPNADKTALYKANDTVKNTYLYLLVNKGRTLLEGDITQKGKFTENGVFNKKLTINNKNYADYDFNARTPNAPAGFAGAVTTPVTDNYYSTSNKIPRNNISLDVRSGRVVLGGQSRDDANLDDRSDLFVYGSEWIKRRLEVGGSSSALINTYMNSGRLINDGYYSDGRTTSAMEIKESPALSVAGAAHFAGDVVFGKSLQNGTDSGRQFRYLPNRKAHTGDAAKIIFWGNSQDALLNEKGDTILDWKSDFDFHGKAYFDKDVRIGTEKTDTAYSDSNNEADEQNGSLEIFGKDSVTALSVSGPVAMSDMGDSAFSGKQLVLEGTAEKGGLTYAGSVVLNKKAGNDYTGQIEIESTGSTTVKAMGGKNAVALNDAGISASTDGKLAISAAGDAGITASSYALKSATAITGKIGDLTRFYADASSAKMMADDGKNEVLVDKTNSSVDVKSSNVNLKAATVKAGPEDDYRLEISSAESKLRKTDNEQLSLTAGKAELKAGGSTETLSATGISLETVKNVAITGSSNVKIKSTDDYYLELETDSARLYGSSGDSALTLTARSAELATDGPYVRISNTDGDSIQLGDGAGTSEIVLDTDAIELNGKDHISLNSSEIYTETESAVYAQTSLTLQAPSISMTTGTNSKRISFSSAAGIINHPTLSISGGGSSGSKFEAANYVSSSVLGSSVTTLGSKAASPKTSASSSTYVMGNTIYLGPRIQIDSDGSISFGNGVSNSSRIKIDSEGYLWIGNYKMTIGD